VEKSVDGRNSEGMQTARTHDISLSSQGPGKSVLRKARALESVNLKKKARNSKWRKQMQKSIEAGILAVRYHMQ
jgi:hypothetical protein